MAGAVSCSSSSSFLTISSSSLNSTFIRSNQPILISYLTPFPRLSTLTFARRQNQSSSAITSNSNIKKKKKKKKVPEKESIEEGDFDEDAIEALFNLLEEDLKNDLSLEDGDEELTEEDLAKLEKELEEALGSDEETSGMFEEDDDEDVDGEEDDDEEEAPVVLKKWQLRRLASALKTGRRKTSIVGIGGGLRPDLRGLAGSEKTSAGSGCYWSDQRRLGRIGDGSAGSEAVVF